MKAIYVRAVMVAVLTVLCVGAGSPAHADETIREKIARIEDRVIGWRRDIHQHPELGNREFRTAGIVADHLNALGLDELRTEVAHTGVVGILHGGKPGPVVALRADMDALPVTEQVDLPFASTVRTTYNGVEVGVMHACGHDAHTAILMGAAEILAGMKEDVPGTVVFIFQPAEEGTPKGEDGGARMMVAEGVLDDPEVDVIFGLHTWPGPPGLLTVRDGGTMAGSDRLYITVTGRQTHGAMPSMGVDPVTIAAQIIVNLQTMVGRQINAATSPVVISIGKVDGGVRHNIIPDSVQLTGTVRHLNPESRDDLMARIEKTAMMTAEAAGGSAEVEVISYAPPVFNDPDLVARMAPTLKRVAGDAGFIQGAPPTMGAEDFAHYQRRVPGVYFFLGINDEGVGFGEAAPNHSPHFYVNEDALKVGVEAMVAMTLDYMNGQTVKEAAGVE